MQKHKRLERFWTAKVRFLGEQDGPPERELKAKLVQMLDTGSDVYRAYLVRVAYGMSPLVSVALALLSESGKSRDLVERIDGIFGPMFGGHEKLDVIFLSKTEAREIATCCEPFFDKSVTRLR